MPDLQTLKEVIYDGSLFSTMCNKDYSLYEKMSYTGKRLQGNDPFSTVESYENIEKVHVVAMRTMMRLDTVVVVNNVSSARRL